MTPILVLYKNQRKTNALKIFHYKQIAKTKSHEKLYKKVCFYRSLTLSLFNFSFIKKPYIDMVFNNTQHIVLFQLSLRSPVTLYFKQLYCL